MDREPDVIKRIVKAEKQKGDRTGLRPGARDAASKELDRPRNTLSAPDAERTSPAPDAGRPRISLGNLTIELAAFRVRVAEDIVYLPMREFELLTMLASNPDLVIRPEVLTETLWQASDKRARQSARPHTSPQAEALSGPSVQNPHRPGQGLRSSIRGVSSRYSGNRDARFEHLPLVLERCAELKT